MSNSPRRELLLVEDNPDDLELELRALGQANLSDRVQVARDGAEALAYIFGEGPQTARNLPDLPTIIMLDLKLPKIDGLEVLRRLRADPRTREVPVAVLTSSKEQQDIIESYRLGVNSYIVKPVDFAGFTQTVQKLGLYWLLLNEPPLSTR